VIDTNAIRLRFEVLAPFLNERARRLLAASEAHAAGRGGITAVSGATGVARSTIGRGLAELRSDKACPSPRIRRPGGGRKPKIETEPGLLEALAELVQSAIRGDPEAALLWVSKSQLHLAAALAERGFTASQKLVGRRLRRLGFSLQANRKTREGTKPSGPERAIRIHQHTGQRIPGRRTVDHLGGHQEEGTRGGPSGQAQGHASKTMDASCVPRVSPSRSECMTS